MHEKSDHEALKKKIELGRFARAASMAEQTGSSQEEIRNLRFKALGQMSAVYRNAPGTKYLALQYGFSREEVSEALKAFVDEMKKEGNHKPLEPCYDHGTGKYLSFEDWMDHYLKIWDKITA